MATEMLFSSTRSGNATPDLAVCSPSPSNVDVHRGCPSSQLSAHRAAKEGRTGHPEETCQPYSIAGLLKEVLTHMYSDTEVDALRNAFFSASEQPPVTTQSLGELDTQNITNNVRLRHDLNFDLVCSFRPNLDGARGAKKRRMMEQYWDALVAEVSLYARLFNNTSQPDYRESWWPELVAQAERRIPLMFDTIRDVLKSLVPVPDHHNIDDVLDRPLLMQQIERGVLFDCTLVRLAEWLNQFLKQHCAPIRDALLDRMVEEFKDAVAQQDLRKLVNGLCRLVEILEAMKLDIANHQVRQLRMYLTVQTIPFEREYHFRSLVTGQSKLDLRVAHRWYEGALSRFQHTCSGLPELLHLEVLTRAVTSAVFQMYPHLDLPETFYLDHDRLRVLALEICDIVHLQICLDAFDDICRRFGYVRSQRKVSLCDPRLRSDILAVVGGKNGSESWQQHSRNIAVTLLRGLSSFYGIVIGNYDQAVEDTGLARQICVLFEKRFGEVALQLQSYIMPQVFASVQSHIHASAVDLFKNFAVASAKLPLLSEAPLPFHFTSNPGSSISAPGPERSIVNRLAHVIILHWQTWADFAYLTNETSLELQSQPATFSGERGASTKKSPTVTSASSAATASPSASASSVTTKSSTFVVVERVD